MILIRNDVAFVTRGTERIWSQFGSSLFVRRCCDVGRPNEDLACHLNDVYLKHRFEDVELFP